jgi:Flp pilus assembly protein TadG
MIDPETTPATHRRRPLRPGVRGVLSARSPRRESGQALVEFALVLPILMLLVMGIIDFGFAFNQWNTAQNAAREGARIAAVSRSESTIKNRVKVTGGTINLTGNGDITLSCNRPLINNTFTDCTQNLEGTGTCTNGPCATPGTWDEREGDIVQVNVKHPYRFVTPLPRLIGLGSTIDLKASIQTRFEG